MKFIERVLLRERKQRGLAERASRAGCTCGQLPGGRLVIGEHEPRACEHFRVEGSLILEESEHTKYSHLKRYLT